jgi:ribonuclease-3
MADTEATLAALCAALGHEFRDPSLLADALTHSSYKNEKPAVVRSDNERLEFLGDAVLQWAVSTLLWERFAAASAGEMTRRRADLVCEEALAGIARSVALGAALRLGRGEERSGGRDKPRLLASALEAVVAAVYLDAGTQAALALCHRIFQELLGGRAPGERDFKTRVQEMLQSRGHRPPTYEVQRESGPDHARSYRVAILVDGVAYAQGDGRSKLEAEQAAAEQALSLLDAEAAGGATTG